jgi:hypothetical protein
MSSVTEILKKINKQEAQWARMKELCERWPALALFIRPTYTCVARELVLELFPKLREVDRNNLTLVIASKLQEVENVVSEFSRLAIEDCKPENLDEWFPKNFVMGIDLQIVRRIEPGGAA